MATEGKSLVRALSVGFVLIIVHAFLFTQADALFPTKAAEYKIVIATYAVLVAFIFSFDARSSRQTERPLFTAAFFGMQGILKFAIAVSVSLLILIPFGIFIRGGVALGEVYQAVTGVGLGIILLHAFIVSFDEELIFRGFVVNELRANGAKETVVKWTQAIVFAAFHYAVVGGEILLLLVYIPLGLAFFAIREKYSPRTQMANIGAHFAWNFFVLGFVQALGV